jgi:hypothetical protein
MQRLHNKRTTLHDQRTGRELWKMTSWDECHCVAPYMYFQAFSHDERFLVFLSDRSGRWELYRLEVASGESAQLTDGSRSVSAPNFLYKFDVEPSGRELVFLNGHGIGAVDIETGAPREVTRCPPEWKASFAGPIFSFDGRQVYSVFIDPQGYQHIVSAPLEGGTAEVIYRWPEAERKIHHMLAAPTEGLVITFAPSPDRQNKIDEAREHRARSWKFDAASGRCEPFLVMPPGFRATHEHWGITADGETRLFCHKKTVPTWTPASLVSIALDGGDFQEHYVSDRKLGHSSLSPDGRTLVSDVQDVGENELIAVDLSTGKDEVLCWPNTRGGQSEDGIQFGHVHPAFSRSGKYVIYTSDEAGKAAIYILPLETQ